MSLINLRDKTINAKIVYYGTALSGKTTSLKHVHRVIDPEDRMQLVSLNTEGDRTLFFDFLPIPLGELNGFQVKLQAFTVPGQVKYNLTRRYVLRGADGVIFVADSREEAAEDNIRSLVSLRDNLEANGIDPEAVPLVIQYNKRDVPGAAPVDRLRQTLNRGGVPDVETVATSGDGVFEGFAKLCCAMVEGIAAEYRIGDPLRARALLEARLAECLVAFRAPAGMREGAERPDVTGEVWDSRELAEPAAAVSSEPSTSTIHLSAVRDLTRDDGTPDVEAVLERAVDANIESARLLAELHETRRRLSDHVRQLAALHETGVVISSELNPDRLLRRVLNAALRTVGTYHGSVLLLENQGTTLRQKLVQGFVADPLAREGHPEPRLLERVLARRPFVLHAGQEQDLLRSPHPADPLPAVALVAPLVHQQEVLGALTAYLPDRPLEPDVQLRLRFLAAVATQAAVALENSRLYARVESFNRDLERKVAERTRELEQALDELKALDALKDDFLSSMSHELLTPLTSISSFAEILAQVSGDEGPAAAQERGEFASIVHREAVRLTEMLQTVLDLSRLEAGKVAMAASEVDLREGLLAAYQRKRPQFKRKGLRVRVRVEEGMAPACADPRWMGKVYDELLSNAVKFSPDGGEISVTISRRRSDARVEVRDRGPGVASELRGCVFEKFKQLGDVLTEKPPGLGLGLPFARAIVTRQGGELWHEEPPDGVGSLFVFTLPLARAVPARR